MGSEANSVRGSWVVALGACMMAVALVAPAQAGLLPSLGPAIAAPPGGSDTPEAAPASSVYFEPNLGQAPSGAAFIARGATQDVLLGSSGVFLMQRERADDPFAALQDPTQPPHEPSDMARVHVVAMSFANARGAEVTAHEVVPGVSHYLLGDDPDAWVRGVPHYAQVHYAEVWPGVGAAFYGTPQGDVEWDFVVAPGADAGAVGLRFEGQDGLSVTEEGLRLATPLGELRVRAPVAYQDTPAGRVPVEARFKLREDGLVGFALGARDPARALVIDPILAYASNLGGSGNDGAADIAADAAGNMYVGGSTNSATFPAALLPGPTVLPDAFLVLLEPLSGTLVYGTYLGGGAWEVAKGIALDKEGNAYVAGWSWDNWFSGDPRPFPTTIGAFQTSPSGSWDGWVAKINPVESKLAYSTYLGGSYDDNIDGVAVDAGGRAIVTGYSAQLPLKNPLRGFLGYDAFVTVLNPEGSALEFSTALGGTGTEKGRAIGVDALGNVFLTGETTSSNLPTVNALQPSSGGGYDGFVAKVLADFSAFGFVTYLGGAGTEQLWDLEVTPAGDVVVLGDQRYGPSTTYPLVDSVFGTGGTVVTRIEGDGSAVAFSTRLPGEDMRYLKGLSVDAMGTIYAAGPHYGVPFPRTFNAVQCSNSGPSDAWVAKILDVPAALPALPLPACGTPA